MKNTLYNPYVTEAIHHVNRNVAGICYSVPYISLDSGNSNILNTCNIISLHNQLATEAALMIIPFDEMRLQGLLKVPDAYAHLQNPRVRLGINYLSLKAHSMALLELTKKFSFWLYDFAPPGADWRLLKNFPFSGIVLSESFFNENYQKFTFPFFMEPFRERGAEVIVRSHEPTLSPEQFATLNISGWQHQRSAGELLDNK
ncbi:hypothetical protein O3W44_10980 [Pantoea sp. LMR881]|uniref:hypothetical protein n=1 Tax=Pantoea sp. LMR881 TaxID=3014336 RepID=UPI0022AF4DB2|nr:hypothetical protein [Pantoea sp. LMR881]MCZ4059499.1 hypothetical protein [Pantoea sp. LMR881]